MPTLMVGQESNVEALFIFLAAFGGGLAGAIALLIVEWVRRFWDRRRLEVKAYLGDIVGERGLYVFLEATNPSDKPVTVTSFGLHYKAGEKPKLWIPPQRGYPLPWTIDGGKSHTEWLSLNSLLEHVRSSSRTPSGLKWVWFNTQTGNTYRRKLDRKFLRELAKEFDRQAQAGKG